MGTISEHDGNRNIEYSLFILLTVLPCWGNQTKQNPNMILSVPKGGYKKAGEGPSQGHGVKDKGEWP